MCSHMLLMFTTVDLEQVAASLIVCSVSFNETWNQLNKPNNPCVQQVLPKGSNSTNCPLLDSYYNGFNMWGVIGSRRIIWDGNYYIFLLSVITASMVAQVVLSLLGRRWESLRAIMLPVILAAPAQILFSGTANFNTFLAIALVFYWIAHTRFRGWTMRWQYLLGAAVTGGTAFASGMVLLFINEIHPEWWGSASDDHCPLATCPTAPGISVEGCVWH